MAMVVDQSGQVAKVASAEQVQTSIITWMPKLLADTCHRQSLAHVNYSSSFSNLLGVCEIDWPGTVLLFFFSICSFFKSGRPLTYKGYHQHLAMAGQGKNGDGGGSKWTSNNGGKRWKWLQDPQFQLA